MWQSLHWTQGLLLSLHTFFSRVACEGGDLCLPSSEPSVCQMETRLLSSQHPQIGTCRDPPPVNKALFYSCCLRAGGQCSKWAVENYLDCLIGDTVYGQAGLLCHHPGLREAERGGESHSGTPSPPALEDPTPTTATEETQPGFAVLPICSLHIQLSNLCCLLPKSTAGLTLCTKCTPISGSSSKCPH